MSSPDGEDGDEKHDEKQDESNGADKAKRRGHHDSDKHMKTGMYLKREIHFTVESPDGEQMPVRYKPEMSVENLFSLASKKFHLSHHDHYLVFNNKEMEAGESLKKFNINQNSVVRVYKGSRKSNSPDIFVSVRIRDCRIGSVFRQTDNLWYIITRLLSSSSIEPDMVPIVIYMKSELIGEPVLKQVRLRDMGITHGGVILRFLQLKQEDLDQRKMKEDEDTMATLESLELKAAGPTADAGLRNVHFRLSEDELDSENIQFIGERKALAFRLPAAETPEEKLQQDYFDLLVEEIQSLFTEKSRQKPNASKIDLKDMVQADLKKLKEIRSDYDECIVRIQFPDRMVLQFLMLPEERIGDIKDFMKKFLRDQTCDYDLTVPHTKEVLPDAVSLLDLGLIPVARFYFSPKDMRFESVEQYLADEFMISCVPYNIGKEAALMLRGESLENFLLGDTERDSMLRKSTGGFLSKFQRSSHSSGRASRDGGGSRSKSVWAKKQSSFQPRKWSRGSSMRGSDDDDDEDSASVMGSTRKIAAEKSSFRVSKTSSSRMSESTQPTPAEKEWSPVSGRSDDDSPENSTEKDGDEDTLTATSRRKSPQLKKKRNSDDDDDD